MNRCRKEILSALEDISSIRSSTTSKHNAINRLERIVASTCASPTSQNALPLSILLELQDGFECNIASRLLPFIAQCLPTLRAQAVDEGNGASSEDYVIYCSISQAMSLIQGLALLHSASKLFLSNKWVIDLFLCLLDCPHIEPSISLPASPTKSTAKPPLAGTEIPPRLASVVVDTLLCVLVDEPRAIRAFEQVNGLEFIVRTLKRTGVHKDTRMKCMEFLYWYLLPEDALPTLITPTPTLSVPSSPTKRSAGSVHANPSWPSSTSMPPVPLPGISTPPSSPTKTSRNGLLRRELDFVPTTPKRPNISRPTFGTPLGNARPVGTDSPLASPTKKRMLIPSTSMTSDRPSRVPSREPSKTSSENTLAMPARLFPSKSSSVSTSYVKSPEEKKALLGTLLGNVDVLVESVGRVGVWG